MTHLCRYYDPCFEKLRAEKKNAPESINEATTNIEIIKDILLFLIVSICFYSRNKEEYITNVYIFITKYKKPIKTI